MSDHLYIIFTLSLQSIFVVAVVVVVVVVFEVIVVFVLVVAFGHLMSRNPKKSRFQKYCGTDGHDLL